MALIQILGFTLAKQDYDFLKIPYISELCGSHLFICWWVVGNLGSIFKELVFIKKLLNNAFASCAWQNGLKQAGHEAGQFNKKCCTIIRSYTEIEEYVGETTQQF